MLVSKSSDAVVMFMLLADGLILAARSIYATCDWQNSFAVSHIADATLIGRLGSD
jgi:hypothetical protein